MTSLLLTLHKIHDCLAVICKAESEILSTNVLGLFKKKNHPAFEEALSVAVNRLDELIWDLNRLRERFYSMVGPRKVIGDAVEYASALSSSSAQLSLINRRLYDKSRGAYYPMSEYQSDLAQFALLQEDYCRLGERLNADYKLYASEIVALDM